MIQTTTINLFYPMLFTVIVIAIIAICSVIKYRNGNMTFKDMFSKSSDNAKEVTIDTTTKMKDMHSEVVKAEFTEAHEKEIHSLEVKTHSLEFKTDRMEELINGIRDDLDLLMKEYRKTH